MIAPPRSPTIRRAIMGLSLNHLVLESSPEATARPGVGRKPSWLKMKMPVGPGYLKLLTLVNEQRLHTVCQSAKCPNMGECWAAGTATLMILGDVCTRSCGFCHIATGRPPVLDLDEPVRVGKAVAASGHYPQATFGSILATARGSSDSCARGGAFACRGTPFTRASRSEEHFFNRSEDKLRAADEVVLRL